MSTKIISILLFVTVSRSIASGIYGEWNPHHGYHNSEGHGYGHGHADNGIYGKDYNHDYSHGVESDGGHATGFKKGAKSDWANYQYGGEGARAEGDAFAKSYGTSFGDGSDAGHAHGHDADHAVAHGNGFNHNNQWGYLPSHYGHHFDEHYPQHHGFGHYPW